MEVYGQAIGKEGLATSASLPECTLLLCAIFELITSAHLRTLGIVIMHTGLDFGKSHTVNSSPSLGVVLLALMVLLTSSCAMNETQKRTGTGAAIGALGGHYSAPAGECGNWRGGRAAGAICMINTINVKMRNLKMNSCDRRTRR